MALCVTSVKAAWQRKNNKIKIKKAEYKARKVAGGPSANKAITDQLRQNMLKRFGDNGLNDKVLLFGERNVRIQLAKYPLLVAFFGTDAHYDGINHMVKLGMCGRAVKTLAYTMDKLREIRDHGLLPYAGHHHQYRSSPIFTFGMRFQKQEDRKKFVKQAKQLPIYTEKNVTDQKLVDDLQTVATALYAMKKEIKKKGGTLSMEETQDMIKRHIVSDDYIQTLLLEKVGNADDPHGISIRQGNFRTVVDSSIGFTWYYYYVDELGMGSSHWLAKFNLTKMNELRQYAGDKEAKDKFDKLFVLSWVAFDGSMDVRRKEHKYMCHQLMLVVPFDADDDKTSLEHFFRDTFMRLWGCTMNKSVVEHSRIEGGKSIVKLITSSKAHLKAFADDVLRLPETEKFTMKYKYDNLLLWRDYDLPGNDNVDESAAPLGNLNDDEETESDDDTISLYTENEETDDDGSAAPLGNLKDDEENAASDDETVSEYEETDDDEN
jgi:hypothetical protein